MNIVRRGAIVAAVVLPLLGLAVPASADVVVKLDSEKCPSPTVLVKVAGLALCVDADLAVLVN